MSIMEWGAVIVGIAIVGLLSKLGRKKPTPGRVGIVAVGPRERVSVPAVLFGLVKITVLFAIYIVATTPLLASPPRYIVEWWYVVPLIDIFAFALIFASSIPKSYSRYMDRKGKKNHSPLDYFVGIVLTPIVFGGMGIHLVTLANDPGFRAWDLEPSSQITTPGDADA